MGTLSVLIVFLEKYYSYIYMDLANEYVLIFTQKILEANNFFGWWVKHWLWQTLVGEFSVLRKRQGIDIF